MSGCGAVRRARGLCTRHYQRAKSRQELPPISVLATLPPVPIDRDEMNYLAGMFDGEGTVCILRVRGWTKRRPTPKYELRVGVVMTHEATVRRFAELFAGSKVRIDRRRRKTKYMWAASSRLAERVLETLRPALRVKTPHVEIATAFMATFVAENRGRNLVDQAIFIERTRLADAMGALNDSHWQAKRLVST